MRTHQLSIQSSFNPSLKTRGGGKKKKANMTKVLNTVTTNMSTYSKSELNVSSEILNQIIRTNELDNKISNIFSVSRIYIQRFGKT